MKSSVIDSPTDICLEMRHTPDGMPLEENRFATEPMLLFRPAYTRQREQEENRFATELMFAFRPARALQNEQEEAWHTSFEEAISERAARVSQQLRRLSTTGLELTVPETDPLPVAPCSLLARANSFLHARKRTILLLCLGLSLFLVGFDLMGLLVALR